VLPGKYRQPEQHRAHRREQAEDHDRAVAYRRRAVSKRPTGRDGSARADRLEPAPELLRPRVHQRSEAALRPIASTSRVRGELDRVFPRMNPRDALRRHEDNAAQYASPANGQHVDAVRAQPNVLDDPGAAPCSLDAKADAVEEPVPADRAVRRERLLVLRRHPGEDAKSLRMAART